MDQGQAVDKDGDVVAVRARARVDGVLADHLHLVSVNIGLVDEADVLGGAVVAGEDLHVVFLDAASFGDDGVPVGGGDIDDRVTVEVLPFPVTEAVVVEGLQLDAQVRFKAVAVVDVRMFVGLGAQLFDEVVFEGGFALIVLLLVTGRVVETDDREFVGDDNGFDAGARCVGGHSRSFLYGSHSRGRGWHPGGLPPVSVALIRC